MKKVIAFIKKYINLPKSYKKATELISKLMDDINTLTSAVKMLEQENKRLNSAFAIALQEIEELREELQKGEC